MPLAGCFQVQRRGSLHHAWPGALYAAKRMGGTAHRRTQPGDFRQRARLQQPVASGNLFASPSARLRDFSAQHKLRSCQSMICLPSITMP
jgi:hypothetical protein